MKDQLFAETVDELPNKRNSTLGILPTALENPTIENRDH